MVLKWFRNPVAFLTEEQALDGLPLKKADEKRLAQATYHYLNTWGCINFGVLTDGDSDEFQRLVAKRCALHKIKFPPKFSPQNFRIFNALF